MLLKNGSTNQEAVQEKRQQKKKKQQSEWARGGGGDCSVCECSFYSSSEQIFINFQALGLHLTGCLRGCIWQRIEEASKGVPTGLC